MFVDCHRTVSGHLGNYTRKFSTVNHLRNKRATSGVPCDIFSNTKHPARFGQGPGYKFRDLPYSCLSLCRRCMFMGKDRENIVSITSPNIFIHDHLGFGYEYGLGCFREHDTLVDNAVVFNQVHVKLHTSTFAIPPV